MGLCSRQVGWHLGGHRANRETDGPRACCVGLSQVVSAVITVWGQDRVTRALEGWLHLLEGDEGAGKTQAGCSPHSATFGGPSRATFDRQEGKPGSAGALPSESAF